METMWLIDGWVVYIGACATVPGLVWTMYYKKYYVLTNLYLNEMGYGYFEWLKCVQKVWELDAFNEQEMRVLPRPI